MPSLNLCQLIGHVGADPEVRTFDNGNKIATTRIAVSERFTDRNNQPQERTEWIGLVFNGKLADLAEKYIHKGSSVYVSGKWHNREWQDQSGNKRQSTELTVLTLQLLDKRGEQNATAQPAYQAPAPGYAPQPQYQQPAPPPQHAPQPQYQAPAPPPQPTYQPAPVPSTPQYQQPAPPPLNDPTYMQQASDDLPF